MRDARILEKFSLERFPDCFKEYADMLTWFEPYRTVLDTSDAPFWKWFVGGKINACYNCVDRNRPTYKNKAASIFVPEPEKEPDVSITYQELCDRVNEVAALLRGLGLKAATASPSTCRWCRSCRSRCWRVRVWASSIRKSSAGSAGRRAARASTIRAAAC